MRRKGLWVWVSVLVFAMSLTLLASCAKEAFKETPGAPQLKEKPYPEMGTEEGAEAPSAMGVAEGEAEEQLEMTEAEREAAIREQALREQEERERLELLERQQQQAEEAAATAEMRRKFEAQSIYFEFDSAVLAEEGKKTLQAKAEFLRDHSNRNVLVEGHCDERGSVEYNLALGQRRAESAQRYLVLLGVNPSRVRTISYGKERPADPRHNEEAWAKNRRAEFILE